MTAWDVIRQLRNKKPDFFEDCIDERILLNEEEYPQSRRVENNNDFFSENNETFPKEIFPRELSKLDLPTIDYEAINAKVRRNGTDALAWYRSFHWKEPQRWGIYIPVSSIYYLSRIFNSSVQPSEFLNLLNTSYKVLVLHEYFHYIVDMAAATLESANSFNQNLYKSYSQNKNSPEESVANAWTLKKHLRPYRNEIETFMGMQPSEYTRFRDYAGSSFIDGLREIGNLLVRNNRDLLVPIENIFKLNERKKSKIPIYILYTNEIPETSPYFLQYFSPIFSVDCIKKSDRFERNFKKIKKGFPRIENMLKDAVDGLCGQASTGGLGFKQIRGSSKRYEFRLDRNYRVLANMNDSTQLVLEDVVKHKGIS